MSCKIAAFDERRLTSVTMAVLSPPAVLRPAKVIVCAPPDRHGKARHGCGLGAVDQHPDILIVSQSSHGGKAQRIHSTEHCGACAIFVPAMMRETAALKPVAASPSSAPASCVSSIGRSCPSACDRCC
jgi:hypothetical protein